MSSLLLAIQMAIKAKYPLIGKWLKCLEVGGLHSALVDIVVGVNILYRQVF